MFPSTDRHYYRLMLLCLLGMAAAFLGAFALSDANLEYYIDESGPVQIFSSAGYLIVLIALMCEFGWSFMRQHLYFAVILVAACLREMDFHHRFTTMSINKKAFYLSPDVPLAEKALAVAVFAILIWAGIMLVWRHGQQFLANLRDRKDYAVAILISALLAITSKVIDGLGRKLKAIGIFMSDNAELATAVLEEVMELGIPVFLIIAVFAYARRSRPLDARSD